MANMGSTIQNGDIEPLKSFKISQITRQNLFHEGLSEIISHLYK